MQRSIEVAVVLAAVAGFATHGSASERIVLESARRIPVVAEADVVIVGGSSAGVSAAVEAAGAGAKVFLLTPEPYLGADLVGTYRLWPETQATGSVPLARKLFESSPPTPMHVKSTLAQALLDSGVSFLLDNMRAYATILDAPGDTSRPLLRAAHERAARPEFKLALAELLAMLDDPAGAATLLAALETASQWDEGWRFQGMANHGAGYSRLDSVILDLAAIGHRPAVGAILAKLRLLSGASEFSHFRCCALALEQFRAPEAAPALAELLGREGLGGHATADLAAAFRNAPAPQDSYAK